MIKSGLLLSSGNASIALLSLVRNVLIARLISVENFGVAATFAVAFTLIEMVTYLGFDRLMIQARDGGASRIQSTLHTLQILRGLIGSFALFAAAQPIALFFNVPESAWAYQLLALGPIVRGFAHLDMYRLQRKMRFLPAISVDLIPQLAIAVLAMPAALYWNDYRAVLFLLLVQQFVFTIVSHAVALRSYRCGWDTTLIRRALTFGWPLLANGVVLFAIFQGDRIIVGGLIGIVELGWFSAAFMLTSVCVGIATKVLTSLFLPQLSKQTDDAGSFDLLCAVVIQIACLIGIIMTIGFAVFGPFVFTNLFGEIYLAGLPALLWLAILFSVTVIRTGPSTIALSKADTASPLISNILRLFTFPVAWMMAAEGASVTTVIKIGICGETVALLASIILLQQRTLIAVDRFATVYLGSIATLGIACWFSHAWFHSVSSQDTFDIRRIGLFGLVIPILWAMPELRRWFGHARLSG